MQINKNIQMSEKNGSDAELGIYATTHIGGRNSILNDNDTDLRLILIYLCIKGTNGIIYK